MVRTPIYLDNHSTTQPDPRVVDAMLPFLREHFGNAASRQHSFGWMAEAAVNHARNQIADLIAADHDEIYFVSGATESVNLAIRGVVEARLAQGAASVHAVTVATEHKSVLDSCAWCESHGVRVTVLPVDGAGMVDVEDLKDALTHETVLVSVMLANNEIGTIGPLQTIGELCRSRGILLHSDATQAVGKIPVDAPQLLLDFMSFNAHKMYGPKGIGALYVRKEIPRRHVAAQILGGGHERGLRSGTLNVPAIVGFGAAAEIARTEMASDAAHTSMLRERLIKGLENHLEDFTVNGHATHRLPNNVSITFAGAPADDVVLLMKDVAVSSGSACSSASPEPSHVLRAIGRSVAEAKATLRVGLGRFNTLKEIDYAVDRIVESVRTVRARRSAGTDSTMTPNSTVHRYSPKESYEAS